MTVEMGTLYRSSSLDEDTVHLLHLSVALLVLSVVRGFAKLKKIKKSKKKLEVGGWVQVSFRFNLFGKSSKNKMLCLYNSPLLGGARGAT